MHSSVIANTLKICINLHRCEINHGFAKILFLKVVKNTHLDLQVCLIDVPKRATFAQSGLGLDCHSVGVFRFENHWQKCF